MTKESYQPFPGFYDLRAFDIPKKEFQKIYNVQEFLYSVEQNRRKGIIHPQIEEVREMSGKYQQTLFSYKVINEELL